MYGTCTVLCTNTQFLIVMEAAKVYVLAVVETAAQEKGVLGKDRISDGWFRRFLERQPQYYYIM